jgi:hypothetical protein
MLLLAHIWLGPLVFLSVALAVLLVNRRCTRFLLYARFLLLNARVGRRRWIAASAMLAVVAAAIAQAVSAAYAEDVTKVQSILDDPSAVHMPVHNFNFNPAGSAHGSR